MSRKPWMKLAIIVPILVLLLALDTLPALEGIPLLAVALGLALVVTDRLRVWLQSSGRVGVAMLPFMVAALVLLLAFCRGRNLSQAVLLLVTLGIVFDILMVALAAIAEVGKRGVKGAFEFAALTGVGLALGLLLSVAFVVQVGRLGGMSLAEP